MEKDKIGFVLKNFYFIWSLLDENLNSSDFGLGFYFYFMFCYAFVFKE